MSTETPSAWGFVFELLLFLESLGPDYLSPANHMAATLMFSVVEIFVCKLNTVEREYRPFNMLFVDINQFSRQNIDKL